MRPAPPLLLLLLCALACTAGGATPPARAPAATVGPAARHAPTATCGVLRLHFYDVGQGLSVLVDLPSGRHVLVDAGDSPARGGCADVCAHAHTHLLDRLTADLRGAPIDLLWITHQHSDHDGGAPDVLGRFHVLRYVDNGRDLDKAHVRAAREAAARAGTPVEVVDPDHPALVPPLAGVSTVLPRAWPGACRRDPNECSIALRVDDCASSALFVGDAETPLERRLPARPATVLQVGHHGSSTSSGDAFLREVAPRYAVISSGKPHEGLNREYCHPRAAVVRRLSAELGGTGAPLRAYDANKCDDADDASWKMVPASDRLWDTSRDGDVVLVSSGDGAFTRQ